MVFHCHFHVIPRFADDSMPIKWAPSRSTMLSNDEASAMLAKMAGPARMEGEGAPYEQALAQLDNLLGEMRVGGVSAPKQPAPKAPAPAAPKAAKKGAEGGGNEPKKEPKEKAPKKEPNQERPMGVKKERPPKKAPPPEEPSRPIDVSWADIRVGKIIDAQPHPEVSTPLLAL